MKKKKGLFFKLVYLIAKLRVGKYKFVGLDNIPDEPSLIISNHAQTYGPVVSQTRYPFKVHAWCTGEMLNKKEIPEYAMKDFWASRSKFKRGVCRIFIKIIAPFVAHEFNGLNAIGVYKDARIMVTFKHTVELLKQGEHIIIFPEKHSPYNNVINDFQDKFIDVARLYYKTTGKEVNFVPTYIAPRLKTVVFGRPIAFNAKIDVNVLREEIGKYLKEEITNLALELPLHRVVPYENLPKKKYPYSK